MSKAYAICGDNMCYRETITKENFDSTKENLQSQINSLASGSPLTASSTSGMTDKTKVYVNTTNGHWYYHNGTSWVDGGVYQAMEIPNKSITEEKTTFYETNENKFLVSKKNEKGYNIDFDFKTGITSISGTVNASGGVEVSRFTIDETTTFKYIRTHLTSVNSFVKIFNINDLTTPVHTLSVNITEGEYELSAGTYAIYIQANMNTVLNEQSRYYLVSLDTYNSQNIIPKYNLYTPSYSNSHANEVNRDLYPFKDLLIARLIGAENSFVGDLNLVENKLTIKSSTRFMYSYNFKNKKHTTYTKMDLIKSDFVETIDLINASYPNDLYYVCLDYKGILRSIPGSLFSAENDNYFIICIFMSKEGKIVSYNTFNNKFNVIGGTSNEKDLSDLTLCCIGDSMTFPSAEGSNALNPTYPETVKNILGLASVTNCGLSGSTVANSTLSPSTPMSNDTRMASYPNADIIVVAGGYNDWGNSVPLGQLSASEDTFYGGYQKLIRYLIENNPSSLIIMVITPMANTVPTVKNTNNNTKLDFINAIYDISRYYSIPLLDMHRNGQLGFYNKGTWTNDGLHFNQEYVNNIYAPKIAKFIKDNLS